MSAGSNETRDPHGLPEELEALLADLIESSERQMHREIAQLQLRTITDMREHLRAQCGEVFLRCMQLGLTPGEAQSAACALRIEQHRIGTQGLLAQIKELQAQHCYRIQAIRQWADEQIIKRAAEAARDTATSAE